MLHEHVAGRNYTMGMTENIEMYKKGNIASIPAIRENMLAYVKLLRNHIDKENNILFRMADNVLNNEEQQSLLTQFGEVEAKAGRQVIEEYVSQIHKLSKIYNV
jgi:hemerythrin-like domain-containing protein